MTKEAIKTTVVVIVMVIAKPNTSADETCVDNIAIMMMMQISLMVRHDQYTHIISIVVDEEEEGSDHNVTTR